jgi:phosphoglycerol transferase MdoB-like AlkP superfamily enzyme
MIVTRVLRPLPPTIRFLIWAVGLNLAVFTVFRIVFWLVFHSGAASAPAIELLHAFYLGLKFDLRLALLICLPPLALASLPVLNPVRRPRVRTLWLAYFAVAQAVVVFLYLVDLGHYGYVHARLNATLLEHLQPLSLALGMAWETYPVLWGLALVGVLALIHLFLLRRFAAPELKLATNALGRWTKRGVVVAVLALYVLGIFGKWSWYPLRWSDAYFTPNEFVAAVALNPVLYLADTYDNRTKDFDRRLVRQHYAQVARILGVDKPDPERLSFERWVEPGSKPGAKPAAPLNLVVIHLESFAGFKTGVFGNPLGATPNFDALAHDGILFTNFFIPAVPTARSVFTMLTGIPDNNPGRSASRNPLIVSQHTLVNALKGHDRYYFIGGSATWGNIRGILQKNIEDLHIYEEGTYNAEHLDTWGVSDLAMFEKALSVFKNERKPFFAFIQTSGNHRPYTIPEDVAGRHGFKLAEMDERKLKDAGFDGLDAYNGLRFFDFALGYFFRNARKEPYFRNTVFVMYGDHGNPSARPTPWQQLELTSFHVPMLIYAPGLVHEGRRIDITGSSVDLLPTSLGLMKVPYRNTTLGRDLLRPRPADEHFSLLPIGIVNDEYLLRIAPGGIRRLYRYRSNEPTVDVQSAHPDVVAELGRLHEAFYQTSLYLLHNNPPRPHAPDGRE